MNNKIAQLEIGSVKKTNNYSDTFIAQPNTKTEDIAGKLFLLINIGSPIKNSKKISDFLISEINKNYYNSEKIILKERISTLKIEHIFETALIKTNKNFNETFKKSNLQKLYKAINISIGIIYRDSIHFTNTGRNKIYLIHKIENQDRNTENRFILANLLKNEKPANENKLFSDIMSGKIPEKGTFLFSSENLPEYISNSQLIKILSMLPPVSAVEQIKLILSKVNSFISFQSIIIKNDVKEPQTSKQSNIVDYNKINERKNSISSLNSSERKTENILNSGNISSGKNIFKPKSNQNDKFYIKDKIFLKKRGFNSTTSLKKYSKLIFKVVLGVTLSILELFTKKIKNFNLASVKNTPTILLNNKKIIISIFSIIILVIAFVSTTLLNKKTNTKKIENQQYLDAIVMIEQKLNKAESSMLYSNEDKTKTLVIEITKLINSVSNDQNRDTEKLADFNKKLELITNQLKKVIDINSSQILLEYKDVNSSANIDTITFLSKTNIIYAADSNQNSIYTYNTENKISATILEIDNKLTNLKRSTILNNDNIYYLNNKNIVEFKTNDETINILPIDLSSDSKAYSSMASYGNRIYIINKELSQIQRYTYNTNGFISPLPWLNKTIELKDAIDLAIDGYVYLLKNNGEILKFLKGNKRDLILDDIDPKLEQPINIQVSQDLDFMYVLEPKNKRIVVFTKDGKFINQYSNNNLTPESFQIDEENKILYFLANNKLYSYRMTHY